MHEATAVLDGAFDRLGQWGFEEPNAFVNHGPMVCEALDVLGRPAEVDSWSRLDTGTPPAVPVAVDNFAWRDALGEHERAGEWMGYFERSIGDDGWEAVLREWLPRLLPGLGIALFHGAIRCAHATRAVATADTPARRAELVRALGYWAARLEPRAPADLVSVRRVDDVRVGVAQAAAYAARHYLARPNIFNLHGVTAAMAVAILVDHTDEASGRLALAQVHTEHVALFGDGEPAGEVHGSDIADATLAAAAVATGQDHAVKLVEAARRGYALTGDPVFAAAAERVTRRGLRALNEQPSDVERE